MDLRRDNYRKAQMCADRILLVKKGCFQETPSSNNMRLDDEDYVPEIKQWYHLQGFRMSSDERHTAESLQHAVNEWIRATTGYGCSASFALVRNERSLSVMYGAGSNYFEGSFRSHIPECNLQQTNWLDSRYVNNGLFTGTISSKKLADVFASSDIMDSYISCVIVPLSDEEVQRKAEENRKLISYLNNYKSFQRI